MIRLAVFNIDLAVQFELDMVCSFLCVRVAGESEGLRFEIGFEGFVWDVGCRYC